MGVSFEKIKDPKFIAVATATAILLCLSIIALRRPNGNQTLTSATLTPTPSNTPTQPTSHVTEVTRQMATTPEYLDIISFLLNQEDFSLENYVFGTVEVSPTIDPNAQLYIVMTDGLDRTSWTYSDLASTGRSAVAALPYHHTTSGRYGKVLITDIGSSLNQFTDALKCTTDSLPYFADLNYSHCLYAVSD